MSSSQCCAIRQNLPMQSPEFVFLSNWNFESKTNEKQQCLQDRGPQCGNFKSLFVVAKLGNGLGIVVETAFTGCAMKTSEPLNLDSASSPFPFSVGFFHLIYFSTVKQTHINRLPLVHLVFDTQHRPFDPTQDVKATEAQPRNWPPSLPHGGVSYGGASQRLWCGKSLLKIPTDFLTCQSMISLSQWCGCRNIDTQSQEKVLAV